MRELLTIAIPVYNVGPYIRECLLSVQNQTDARWRAILVDDGSTDGSGAVCDEFAQADGRFTTLHQENAGVSAARNLALARCETDWIWFVDGDDTIAANAVEMLNARLADGLDIVGFAHRMHTARPSTTPISEKRLTMGEIAELCAQNVYARRDSPLAYITTTSASFCAYRREFLREHAILFLDRLRKGQDSFFNACALADAKRYLYLSAELYIYRRNEGSISVRYTRDVDQMTLTLVRAYCSFVAARFPDSGEMRRRARCRAIVAARTVLFLGFCHADNPEPYRERKTDFLCYMANPTVAEAYADLAAMEDEPLPDKLLYALIGRRAFLPLDLLYRFATRRYRKKNG